MDLNDMQQQLCMEIVRRLERVDETKPIEEIIEKLNKYSDKFLMYGHSFNQARKIMISGMRSKIKKGQFKLRNMNNPNIRLKKLIKNKRDEKVCYKQKPMNEKEQQKRDRSRRKMNKVKYEKDIRKMKSLLKVTKTRSGELVKKLKKTEMQLRAV